jgi:L-seryl-tRNA(Ser) seleniumtransferase
VDAARTVLDRARSEIRAGTEPGDLRTALAAEIEAMRAPRLRRVVNATGVIVHTNLGRAPLRAAALERVARSARGYSNLEYDARGAPRLASGPRRGDPRPADRRRGGARRQQQRGRRLARARRARRGREVLVSRGELIEIGDGFPHPRRARTLGCAARRGRHDEPHAAGDYERAIGPDRRSSCGCTSRTSVSSASPSARRWEARPRRPAHGLPLVDDLGSGALSTVVTWGRADARGSLAAGADLVCFSGDKLLGGRRPGSSSGSAEPVERLRRHPLQRRLRADKLTLAALGGRRSRSTSIPLSARGESRAAHARRAARAVRARAERLAGLDGRDGRGDVARVGRRRAAAAELESFACAVEEELAAPLRLGDPPVVGIVRDGHLLLDCRTLAEGEIDDVAAAVAAAR